MRRLPWRLVLLLALGAPFVASSDISGPSVNLLTASSGTPITAATSVYMTPGSGVDLTEGNVVMPLGTRMSFTNLACTTSQATGVGQNVVVTGRAGPCGSLVDTGLACTIAGGLSPGICVTGGVILTVGSHQCFALRVTTPATFPQDTRVNCSLERSA